MKVIPLILTALTTSVGLNYSLISQATPAPSQIGQCSETYITNIGTRLIDGVTGEPIPNSGISVYLNNGILLVSFDKIAEVLDSKRHDRVQLCLQSIPPNCPIGDNRGKVYKVMNYRTGKEFILPNSVYSCGTA